MSLKTPKARREFEIHLNLIIEDSEKIISGIPSVRILKSLQKVKYLPNKRINFLTVTQQTRLIANMQATFKREQNLSKKIKNEKQA